MGMRKFLDDKVSPHFHEGGKFEKYYTFYEMFDTMLYTCLLYTSDAADE